MLRKIRYALEAVLILFAMLFFRLLPLDLASALAGWLGRLAGPFSRAHRTARTNLEIAMPELSDAQRSRILSDMWDNLGRVIGEYPHLYRKALHKRITIEGREHFEGIRASGLPTLFLSGHFANWEAAPLTAAICGSPLVLIYRRANNPVADWVIRRIRASYSESMHGKGRVGAKESIKALKENKSLGMLVDQKFNDGRPVPFFGRPAMTATASAQLAIRLQVPIITAQVVRTHGAHFHVFLSDPILYPPDADELVVMSDIHRQFEGWIREHPAQWMWVHRRWG